MYRLMEQGIQTMRITPATLSRAIERTVSDFMESGEYATVADINEGSCDLFAEAILVGRGFDFVMMGDAEDAGLEELDMESLLVDDAGGSPFDQAAIKERWPWIEPPEGVEWDDLDRLSRDEHFEASAHVFLHMGGRFYDAEAPDGVDSFLDLGFFRRRILQPAPDTTAAP